MIRKPEERKSITVDMPFPVNLDYKDLREYCEVAADSLSKTLRAQMLEKMGPNWFDVYNGPDIHQPGIYRFRIEFKIENELIGGPYARNPVQP